MNSFAATIFSLLFLLTTSNTSLQAQQIALTFDDAPMRSGYFSGSARTDTLLTALKNAGVEQVAFFVVTSRLNAAGTARIERYAQAGHIIANHSHRHQSMRRIGVPNYIDDIFIADSLLRGFAGYNPWYRYPFLDEGRTRSARDAIRAALTGNGYQNAYVTIDNYDWILDALFVEGHRTGRKIDFEQLKALYIEHLWNSVQFYDGLSREVLGRSVRHVLLLHENDLAALFIDDFVYFVRKQGWRIISPIDAYQDAIATIVPDVLLNNQGRVAAIAKAQGYTGPLSQQSEDRNYLEKKFNQLIFDQN